MVCAHFPRLAAVMRTAERLSLVRAKHQEDTNSLTRSCRYPRLIPGRWPHQVKREGSEEATSYSHCKRRLASSSKPADLASSMENRASCYRGSSAIWRIGKERPRGRSCRRTRLY